MTAGADWFRHRIDQSLPDHLCEGMFAVLQSHHRICAVGAARAVAGFAADPGELGCCRRVAEAASLPVTNRMARETKGIGAIIVIRVDSDELLRRAPCTGREQLHGLGMLTLLPALIFSKMTGAALARADVLHAGDGLLSRMAIGIILRGKLGRFGHSN